MASNSISGDNQSGMSFQILLQTGWLQVKQPQKWHITQKTNCNLKQTEFLILHNKKVVSNFAIQTYLFPV
jgi:hypothetical protein